MALYKGKIPVVYRDLDEGWVRGEAGEVSRGAVPRDYAVDPVEMRDNPSGMKLYDASEDDALYEKGEANEDTLEHLYLRAAEAGKFEHLDQNGFPDCWMHSVTHAAMVDRLKQNLPYVKLNAVAAATMTGRTGGGWCGLGMKFLREKGVPVVGPDAPYQSRHYKNTPALQESMKLHRDLEDWYDLGRAEYDQKLSKRQLVTCLHNDLPSPSDYNRFSHSMLSLRYVRLERGHWGLLTLNSWLHYGYLGLCVLADMWPDNAVSLRASTASAA